MFSDSRLVVSQIEGSFKAKDSHMSIVFKVVQGTTIKLPKGRPGQSTKKAEQSRRFIGHFGFVIR